MTKKNFSWEAICSFPKEGGGYRYIRITKFLNLWKRNFSTLPLLWQQPLPSHSVHAHRSVFSLRNRSTGSSKAYKKIRMLWLTPLMSKEMWAVIVWEWETNNMFWSFLTRRRDTENPASTSLILLFRCNIWRGFFNWSCLIVHTDCPIVVIHNGQKSVWVISLRLRCNIVSSSFKPVHSWWNSK